MNPLAKELNDIIHQSNPYIYNMLSDVGKKLYFPKGILSQSAEAKEKAHKFNATIGMAKENGKTMYLPSVMSMISGLKPEESLTYAPSFGVKSLREEWRKEIFNKNPSLKSKEISLPIVTNAITHSLSVVADMWVDPQDPIILPDKLWGNYNIIFSVRRAANIVQFPFFDTNGGFNLKAFKDCIREEAEKKDKIIVLLNFPNNPTGYTPSMTEGAEIADILADVAQKGTNVVVFTDDAYFGLFFEEDILKESIFSKIIAREPRLLPIKLDGATKENYVWGLRVGFITYGGYTDGEQHLLHDALERKTAGAVRGSISNASHLSQSIILKSLQANTYEKEKKDKFNIMKERAIEVKRVLSDSKFDKYWDAYPFNSGYFMCLNLKTIDAEKLRVHLLNTYGVGLISLGKTDLRIAFSCLEKTEVEELFDIILQGAKDLEGD